MFKTLSAMFHTEEKIYGLFSIEIKNYWLVTVITLGVPSGYTDTL